MRKISTFHRWVCQVAVVAGLLITAGCGNGQSANPASTADSVNSIPIQRVQTDGAPAQSWTDSLVRDYIAHSAALQEPGVRDSVTYFFDRREISDTAHYLIFQVGHSLENSFVTDQWLYLDSTRKALFEYDAVADSLVKWSR